MQKFADTMIHLRKREQLLLVPVTLSIGMIAAFRTSDLTVVRIR